MKILAINGSPRKKGNTSILLGEVLRNAEAEGALVEEVSAHDANLKYCRGCLRCNLIRRCSLKDDDWAALSARILDSDVLVFASPIYFHHLPAPMKKILDRFRSFFHVQITENGLVHTPWHEWPKRIVLLLSMGSPENAGARPVIDLFTFLSKELGMDDGPIVITATGLALAGQVHMSRDELESLYEKMSLPARRAEKDFMKNRELLKECRELGKELARG